MLNFQMTDVDEMPYLDAERGCSMDPTEISAVIGDAFQSVMGYLGSKRIKPGAMLSVY